MNLENINERYV